MNIPRAVGVSAGVIVAAFYYHLIALLYDCPLLLLVAYFIVAFFNFFPLFLAFAFCPFAAHCLFQFSFLAALSAQEEMP